MTGEKLCLKVEHMPKHDDSDVCPICKGRVLRFKGGDPGLDDLFDGPEQPERVIVRTKAGFNLHLEDAGTDAQGNQLWRQIRITLGDPMRVCRD